MIERRAILGLAALPLGAGTRRAWSAPGQPQVLARKQERVGDLLQDRTSLYWNAGSTVVKISKRGGQTAMLPTGKAALAAVAGSFLIGEEAVGQTTTLKRFSLAGGEAKTLVEGRERVWRLTADASGVYFNELLSNGLILLFHLPLEGGPQREVAEAPGEVGMMATDATHLYWSDMGGVLAVAKAGGVPTFIGGDESTGTFQIALDEQFVYWSNEQEGTVRRASKRGGRSTRLVHGGRPDALAVRGGFVYFADSDLDRSTGRIRRVPKGGGRAEVVVARPKRSIESLLVDEEALYWVEETDRYQQQQTHEATVMRLPL